MRMRIAILLMVLFLLMENRGVAAGLPLHELRLPDGTVLISDDTTGTIYRVSYPT